MGYEDKMRIAQDKMMEDKQHEIDVLNDRNMHEIASINTLKDSQLNEQMTRLSSQWNEERERNKLHHAATMHKMGSLHKEELVKCKELTQDMIENLDKKHEIEIKKLNEKNKIEKSEWIQIMNNKFNKEFKEKELKMIDLVKKQQADEIDIIIDKLSGEYTQTINELQAKHDAVIDDKLTELGEEKQKCRKWMMQFEDLKLDIKDIGNENIQKIKVIESDRDSKNAEIEKLKQQITESAKETETIKSEKEQKASEFQREKDQRIQEIDELNRKYAECNDKLSKIDASYDTKMKELTEIHATELGRIEARIKQTLCKKDDWILQLKEQIETKTMRINQIENLLNDQRNQLFEQLK